MKPVCCDILRSITLINCVAYSHLLLAQAPVEPLLQKYCLGCHNETERESGLSLQTLASLKQGSDTGPVLDREDLTKSLLLEVLNPASDQAMPPVDQPQPTDDERERLKTWVLSGASLQSMAAGIPKVPALKPFHSVSAGVESIAVSKDGRFIATGGNRTASLSNTADHTSIWTVPLLGKVSDLSFSDDGEFLIAATGLPGVLGQALLLSVQDGSVLREFGGHTDAIYAAKLNSAGTVLATAGYDRRILLHDFVSGKIIRTLEGHNGSIFSLAFDRSGDVLCTASADSTVKVWSVKTGKRLDTLSQPQGEQYTVLVSRDGHRIYAAGADNRLRIWKLVSRKSVRINPQLVSRFAHEQTINRLAMSADGSLLASTAEDGSLTVWDAWPMRHRQTLPIQDVPVTAMAFVANDRLLIARQDGTMDSLPVQQSAATNAAAVPSQKMALALPALTAELIDIPETENNDTPEIAQRISLPATVSGVIQPQEGNDVDADCYRFTAAAGQELIFEVRAARDKSPLDSRLEILTTDGRPVLQTRLQAVRDSYFTFRGKDSDTSGDFRVFNWQEMELNEYLYSDGEVVRLWLYPRGPDSGFVVYPGFGKRHTYFGTTPIAHALQAPCFIVVPRAADEPIVSNGLPVFPVYFENDDDPRRELGRDSRLLFQAPVDGNYVARLTDARGFSGPDFRYALTIRSPVPSFNVTMNNRKLTLQPGTGREIELTARRIDGYEGPIRISVDGLPHGFSFSSPLVIQDEQAKAYGTIYATEGAVEPTEEQLKSIVFRAVADGMAATEIGGLTELKLNTDGKLRLSIGNDRQQANDATFDQPIVIKIRPGETISAILKVDRLKHDGVVSLGKEDSGRNLPHGVFVDNIGLNGLLLLDGDTEREFFITAADWVPPTHVPFHLKANIDGVTSRPVYLEVLPRDDGVQRQVTSAVK